MPGRPGFAGDAAIALGGGVAEGLEGVAAVDQHLPLAEQPLQLDRLHLGAVLLALAVALPDLVVVEEAADPFGGAVAGVDQTPEEIGTVGFGACALDGGSDGVEGVFHHLADAVAVGGVAGVRFVVGGRVAAEFDLVDDMGGRGRGVRGSKSRSGSCAIGVILRLS